jgi:steroid delta-isomerase-like uncharacterized protein
MDPLDAVTRWSDAWNAGDTDAVVASYAKDVVYEHAMVPEPITGRAALAEFVAGMGGAFSETKVDVPHAVVSGDEVAAEVVHTARHTGDLPTPMGPVAATGNTVEIRAAHFFRIDGEGLIAEERMFANPLALLAQIGALPGPS